MSQIKVMAEIDYNGIATAEMLAQNLGANLGTIKNYITRLKKIGFIQEEIKYFYSITPKGKRYLDSLCTRI
jgi:DNA-binding MarR family transcriptional regulator